ncbi:MULTISPECIES: pyridoxamine 5'-phosphate oxidase family protein [unclassified Anabaena]|uniref:pyridoxamine 5'-phosphate oxidase family protein n=1 Tax=unclassified Anabaena TaxID=2619674 RepID=UPI00082BD232|nr:MULTISPECIES: pyridoxamine 5'-phosphate oxidase family protein [unclassified Anabaena]
MANTTVQNQNIEQLRALMKNLNYGMLTTVNDDSSLHSRPMFVNRDIDSDGTIWFFTSSSSHKVIEIEHCQQVNVNFISPNQQQYISITGTAQIVKEPKKIQERWQPELKTWFPQGLDDPNIALLKVNINQVDYWEEASKFHPQTIVLGNRK